MHPEIKEKRIQTNRKKYNTDNPMQNEDVKEKYKLTSQKNNGVNNPVNSKSIKLKIQKTIFSKFHTDFEYITAKINDKEWLKNEHKNKSIKQIANELGITYVTLFKHLKKNNIQTIIHSGSSIGQTEIAKIFTQHGFSTKLNYRNLISPYEVDIFCAEKNIAIEFNGTYWHSELNGCDRQYHLRKTQLCSKQKIQLIHIFDSEWITNRDIICSRIQSLLGINQKIFARQCKVIVPSVQEVMDFLQKNHLQGYVPYKIALGLTFNDQIVALMTFSKPHYSTQYQYEMSRFCNKINFTVVGGASRLFTHFIRKTQPKSIVSYRDIRWGDGQLYHTLNFKLSHISKPNYFYFKNTNPLKLYSRVKFQKHKLSKLLEEFDSSLSEWENMINHNYDRIWDCGNEVWVWSMVE
jgi:hypothetical protein